MVGGQYVDMTVVERDGECCRALHALKKGRLIAASVAVVPILEGLAGPETIPFRRFAAELGVLFQIVDDILDVTGAPRSSASPAERTNDMANSPTSASSASSGPAARRRVPRQGDRGAG